MYKHFFKRLIDIVISFIAIIVLLIPFVLISLLILITNPGPVFFRQKRFGKNSLLKGTSLLPDSTAIERNGKIGGHHE